MNYPGYPQQYGYMPQYQNFPTQNLPAQRAASPFLCFPVSSREEAVAQRAEAFGPGLVMPDLGHGVIYYKKFNNDTALADFAEFRYAQQTAQEATDIGALVDTFTGRLDGMEKKLDGIAERMENKATRRATEK